MAMNPNPTPSSNTTSLRTGEEVRAASRSGVLTTTTSGLAPTYTQANLIILPSRYAADFRTLCARNPVPCPLLAESSSTGCYRTLKSWVNRVTLASDLDIRRDAPKYMVYKDNMLLKDGCLDILQEWNEDHVAFLIGCSFSFESALEEAKLAPRHTLQGTTVPMYRTNIPLSPSGAFDSGTWVVSMRPYKEDDLEAVREITRPFVSTHGEPVAVSVCLALIDAASNLTLLVVGLECSEKARNTKHRYSRMGRSTR